ncbi:type II secretory pathway, component PulD [Polaromonas sp. YR568]|uniref:type II secretion system protein GspD n=1 Tax=Polaromonas sp. YR568 TaxID=1855301 RepID=UPI003137AF38
MKKLLPLLWLFLASLAAAAPTVNDKAINLNFDKISVVTLVNFVYGDILKTNFAVHPDLVELPKQVTVHFQGDFDQGKLSTFMVDLLAGVGVVVEQKRGYVFLRPHVPQLGEVPDKEIFFYRAKYRPVSSLMDITSSLFKTGRFSVQRNIRAADTQSSQLIQPVPLGMPTAAPAATAPPSPAQRQRQGQESSTSATAQIDKGETDSFLFEGTEKEIALLQKLLAQVDTPVPEVFVKGMVYEVTTSMKEGSAFNLAVSILKGRFGLTFGQTLVGSTVSFKNAQIDAVFSALSTDARFKSVSNPSLRVKSGASARFSVGSDVPVLGAVQLDKNGNPVQSIEYKPSGSIFDIKPQIRDSVIDLAISQQLSSFVATTTGVNNSPTLIKREISTSIGAADGDLIVIGGLDEDKASNDSNGFAFLPSWTKSQASDNSKTQILLVLQVQKMP